MKNLIDRKKNRDIGNLEQVCERYAVMAYEVFRRELAMGFKPITYSYTDDETGGNNVGRFSATFIPREETGFTPHARFGHRNTRVTFRVIAEEGTGAWILTDGKVFCLDGIARGFIRFSLDFNSIGLHVPMWDLIRVGVSHNCEEVSDTPENVLAWEQLPGMVKV